MRLLFITWDGPGTTYHETLFMPLLARSARTGDRIGFLQLSWGAAARVDRLDRVARGHGVAFDHLEVPRGRRVVRLPLTMLAGLRFILREARTGRCDTVIARSMIPGGLAVLAVRLARGRLQFIYDADGLAADERVEFGGWRAGGLRYRVFRWLERVSVRRADAILVRTQRAVDILTRRSDTPQDRFVVVPNGKDAEAFAPGDEATRRRTRRALAVPHEAPLLVHVGSAGPQYEPEFTIAVLRHVLERHPDGRLLLLTARMNHGRFRQLASSLPSQAVIIREADPDEVPALLAAADVGLAFRTPTFSQRAVAPIKVAEYLLCGLPVAYRRGVGDLDVHLKEPIGFGVDDVSDTNAAAVAAWICSDVLARREEFRHVARTLGLQRFSLDAGAAAYRRSFEMVEAGS